METHQLRYFVEVVRTGRFTAAAEHCHVSQPSLSQQIKKLEDELGEPLLLRTPSGVVLTGMGEAFLPRAQRILAEMKSAADEASARRGLLAGGLRLGAIPTVAPYLLPDLARRFHEVYPRVTLELSEDVTENLEKALQSGDLDLAIMSVSPLREPFNALPLLSDELLVTMPAGHPFAPRQTIPLSDLAEQPLVLMKEAHCLSQQSVSLCHQSGIDPKVRIRSSQMETVHALVEAGLGLSFTPRMALSALSHRKLRHRAISPQPVYREIGLVHLAGQQLSPLIQSFAQFAQDNVISPKAQM